MIGYVKCFESTKTMSFKSNDKKLLKKYIQIWKRLKIYWISNMIVSQCMVIMINIEKGENKNIW